MSTVKRVARALLVAIDAAPLMLLPTGFVVYLAAGDPLFLYTLAGS